MKLKPAHLMTRTDVKDCRRKLRALRGKIRKSHAHQKLVEGRRLRMCLEASDIERAISAYEAANLSSKGPKPTKTVKKARNIK